MSLATPDRRAAKLVKQRPHSVRGATTVHDPTRSTTLLPLIRQPAAQHVPTAAGDSSDSEDGGYDTAPETPAPPSRSATPAPASIRSARPPALRTPGSASTRFKVTTPPNSARLASPPPTTPLPIPSVTSAQILDVLRVDGSSPVPFPYTIQWPEIPPTPPETPDKRHLALPLRPETPPLQKKPAVEPPSAAAIKPIIAVPENRSRTNVINTPDQHAQKQPVNSTHVSNDARTVKALKEECIIDGRNDAVRAKGASGTNTNAGGTISRRGGAAGGLGTFMATLTPHPSLEPFAPPPSSSSPTAHQVMAKPAPPTVTSKTKISHVKSASLPSYPPPVSAPGSSSASPSAKPRAQPSPRPSSSDQAAAARNGSILPFGSLPKRPNADAAAAHGLAATHGPPTPPAGKDAAEKEGSAKLEAKAAASPTAPARPPTPMRLPPLSPWAPLAVGAKTASAPPSPANFPPRPAAGLASPAPSLRRDAAPTPQPAAAPPTTVTTTSPPATSSPPIAATAVPSRTLSRSSEIHPPRKLHKAPPAAKHSSVPPPTRATTPTSPVEMPLRRFSQLFPQKSEPERARLGSNSKLWPVARSVSLSRAASAGPNAGASAIPRSVSTTSLVEPERAYHYTTRRMSTSTAAMDKDKDVDMLSLASAPGALALATEVDMVVAAGSATRRLRKATTRGPRRAASPSPVPALPNRAGVLEDDVKEMVPRALFSIGGGRGGFAAHRRTGSVPPPVIIPPPSAMLPFPTLVTTGTATTVPPSAAAQLEAPLAPGSARSSACDSDAPRTPADIEVHAHAAAKDEPEADFAGAQLLRSLGSLRRRVARVSGAALRGVGVGDPLAKRGGDVGADMMLVRARLRARAEDEESVVRSMVDSEC